MSDVFGNFFFLNLERFLGRKHFFSFWRTKEQEADTRRRPCVCVEMRTCVLAQKVLSRGNSKVKDARDGCVYTHTTHSSVCFFPQAKRNQNGVKYRKLSHVLGAGVKITNGSS